MPGEGEHRQQLRQIAFQPPHHGPVLPEPAGAEAAERGRGLGVGAALRQINRLRVSPDFVVVPLPRFLQNSAPYAPSSADAALADRRWESPPPDRDSRR